MFIKSLSSQVCMDDGIDALIKTVGHTKGEHIGIIYDTNFSNIATLIKEYCAKRDIEVSSFFKQEEGTLNAGIVSCFIEPTPKIIIIGSEENIWHTAERKKAKYDLKKRLVNLLHPDNPCESYYADIKKIKLLGTQIEKYLQSTKIVRIYSHSGTNLQAEVGRTFCEADEYTHPGSGGDFPIGEVGFGPKIYTVNGQIVYDLKIQHVGFVKNTPQKALVKNDAVIPINGLPEFKSLLQSHPVLRFISEISIGINPIWTEVPNKHSIVEEKNLGTVHFGHGGNSSYGIRQGPHFDAVILSPTVYFDNLLVLENGFLNRNLINF